MTKGEFKNMRLEGITDVRVNYTTERCEPNLSYVDFEIKADLITYESKMHDPSSNEELLFKYVIHDAKLSGTASKATIQRIN